MANRNLKRSTLVEISRNDIYLTILTFDIVMAQQASFFSPKWLDFPREQYNQQVQHLQLYLDSQPDSEHCNVWQVKRRPGVH